MAEKLPDGHRALKPKHPLWLFTAWMLALSGLAHGLSAWSAGGWEKWSGAIVTYRFSTLLDDIFLFLGAYGCTRIVFGPRWFLRASLWSWTAFGVMLGAGAFSLLIMNRRMLLLFGPEPPPLETGWSVVCFRVFAPLAAMGCLRWYACAPQAASLLPRLWKRY